LGGGKTCIVGGQKGRNLGKCFSLCGNYEINLVRIGCRSLEMRQRSKKKRNDGEGRIKKAFFVQSKRRDYLRPGSLHAIGLGFKKKTVGGGGTEQELDADWIKEKWEVTQWSTFNGGKRRGRGCTYLYAKQGDNRRSVQQEAPAWIKGK